MHNSSGGAGRAEPGTLRTERADWDALMLDLFQRAIARTQHGVGVITMGRGLWGHMLRKRLNEQHPSRTVIDFVRKHFDKQAYRRVMNENDGLEPEGRYPLLRVVDESVGLPLQALIGRIQHVSNPELRAVVIFGGSRREGQLERSLERMQAALRGESGPPPDRDRLVSALHKVNTARLSAYDREQLASLNRQLREVRHTLSEEERSKAQTIANYVARLQNRR